MEPHARSNNLLFSLFTLCPAQSSILRKLLTGGGSLERRLLQPLSHSGIETYIFVAQSLNEVGMDPDIRPSFCLDSGRISNSVSGRIIVKKSRIQSDLKFRFRYPFEHKDRISGQSDIQSIPQGSRKTKFFGSGSIN